MSHKGLPKFESEIEDDDLLYVLREYAEGIPLTLYVEENGGKLSVAQTVKIAVRLCDILTYLHSQPVPIIHRDVKPSNIIINIGVNQSVKLIDFGISRRFSKDSDTDTTYFGTKKFSPPEQYGFTQTDCRADIYALGVVIRYMLTGAPDGQVDDKSLTHIIDKCTAFSPDDRYKSAGALKRDLFRYRNNTSGIVLKAAAIALVICASLAVGFCIGRYTDVFTNITRVPDLLSSDAAADEPVTFIEPLIEEAVRLMLDKTDNEPISRSELAEITELYINGDTAVRTSDEYYSAFGGGYGTIVSLEDVRMMPNIRLIQLYDQLLTDVSPLADCLALERIHFHRCPITDVSPLTTLPMLVYLEIYACNIEETSYFKGFNTLELLALGQMPLIDMSKLNVPQIRHLDIRYSAVTSLDEIGLEQFPVMRIMDISGTQIDDFSLLDVFPNIERIHISPYMEQHLDTMTRDDIEVFIQ